METSTPSGSPLRQRMIEDMRMRKLMSSISMESCPPSRGIRTVSGITGKI